MKFVDGRVPISAVGKFLMYWDNELLGGDDALDGLDEFEEDPEYYWELLINPISCKKEVVWNEMSYNRLTEYSLTR